MDILFNKLSLFLFCFVVKSSAAFVAKHPQEALRHQLLLAASESFSSTFDFSSKIGWDEFYQKEEDVVEWHSSIALFDIVKYIPKGSDCLVVGCGNSELPRVIHDDDRTSKGHVTCLDTSSACLDQLRIHHADECPRMSFVCGDAMRLAEVLATSNQQDKNIPVDYDVIVDKGLIDALLCSEGWNGPLEMVLTEASQVLHPSGVYLLISYKLPSSTRTFLEDIGKKVGLEWTFDLAEGNKRVGMSTATKK
mmetsp:Transcript_14803/g.20610  ORF Transcript_14803/g.20610 Transcript_14803/m.20610 type:complete len:250 (-) Transcript_14803:1486-2235(-)